jgi:hypothetical protein
MTHSIHRVQVEITDYQELDLTGPPIFVAADRGGDPEVFDLWFEHYDESAREQHRSYHLYVIGTGNPVPWTTPAVRSVSFDFLGSVITTVNQVWHVYTGPQRDLL